MKIILEHDETRLTTEELQLDLQEYLAAKEAHKWTIGIPAPSPRYDLTYNIANAGYTEVEKQAPPPPPPAPVLKPLVPSLPFDRLLARDKVLQRFLDMLEADPTLLDKFK